MAARSESLPVIDIAGLSSDRPDDRHAVARAIRAACIDSGFFYAAGHGVAPALVAEAFAQSRRFFDQPLSAKLDVAIARSAVSRGYEPIGAQTLDLAAAPDQKESFYIGIERGPDDPLAAAGTPNHGANQWPSGLPGWRASMEAYFAKMSALADLLSRGLALSLGLAEGHFAPYADDPMSILRLLRYPPHPADAGAEVFGCGMHTDWGCLTILAQQDAEGLELRTASGDWILARPIADTFVVNLGDMMARWTNDLYQSTPHRVINASGGERHSIAFFHDINYHALVDCLPTCQGPDNPAKYAPILAGRHIHEMYLKTYGRDAADGRT